MSECDFLPEKEAVRLFLKECGIEDEWIRMSANLIDNIEKNGIDSHYTWLGKEVIYSGGFSAGLIVRAAITGLYFGAKKQREYIENMKKLEESLVDDEPS